VKLALAFVLALALLPAQPPEALSLDGVAHVALRVRDVPAAVEFYRKLGFEQAFEFSDAQGITVSYMKVNDRQFIEIYRRTKAEEPLGLMHLCLDTSNLDALFDAYVSRGLKPTDRRKARAGNLLFNLRDPEGQLIEYTQYLPGSMHSNDRGKNLGERRISSHLVRAATAVKDLEAQRAFYTGKLGCEQRRGSGPVRLLLPGKSGEEIELDPGSPAWTPRITFGVADVRRAGEELRKRGIIPTTSSASRVVVADPDGAALVFIREAAGSK